MLKGQLKQAAEILKAFHMAKAADPTLTDKEAIKLAIQTQSE